MNFENKVALVTGSSRGLGAAIVQDLSSHGCNVVIHYNQSQKEAELLRKEIKNKYSVECLIIQGDISKENDVQRMIQEVIDVFGKIDILVNNAAIALDCIFAEKTAENFRKTLDVNLIGMFMISKIVGDIMKEKQYGKIINISSNNGIGAYHPMSIDYDASKAAVISLTHNLALQYAPYINVNAIAPGWIKTDMSKVEDPDLEEEFMETESEKIYVKRFAEPKEIAKVVTFLASDDASYINSAVITVDGGYSC